MFILLLCFAPTSSVLLPSAPLFLFFLKWIYTPKRSTCNLLNVFRTALTSLKNKVAYYLRAGLMAHDCFWAELMCRNTSLKNPLEEVM